MAKPGARTTWMGWFPRSFTKLLASFQIPTKKAHELALSIRSTITNGMDDIWRERNAAQHTPKERQEINPRVHVAFEKKTLLGLDQGPHEKAEDVTNLPYSRMKKKWLENANKRIDEKEMDNKRKMAAIKALTTGSKWQWNPAANAKEKQPKKKKTEAPVMHSPWAPTSGAAEQPRPHTYKTSRPRTTTKKRIGGNGDTPTVHSPWDPSPMAAPAGSTASAGPAPSVANGATGAAAAAAAARQSVTTAQIRLAPSTDLPRRRRDDAPGTQTHTPTTHAPTTRAGSRASNETEPETPGQDDDPDRIDDVV